MFFIPVKKTPLIKRSYALPEFVCLFSVSDIPQMYTKMPPIFSSSGRDIKNHWPGLKHDFSNRKNQKACPC